MGLKGAAMATSAGYILWTALVTRHYRIESMVSWRDFMFARSAAKTTGDTIGARR